MPFCGLSTGEKLFCRYLRCLAPLKNKSGQLITKLAQKLARINKKPNETQTFPTHSHYGQRFFLEENEGNMEEIGGVRKVGKTSRREAGWVPFCGLSTGEKLFCRYLRCLAPLKNKRGQLLQSQNKSRNLQKKINQWQPNIFLFPLIPCKARNTKLAQKLEKHQKPIKTMFNQWVAERTFV